MTKNNDIQIILNSIADIKIYLKDYWVVNNNQSKVYLAPIPDIIENESNIRTELNRIELQINNIIKQEETK